MDQNFVATLVWIISNEATKDNGFKVDHQDLFKKICDVLSQIKEYNIPLINNGIMDETNIKKGEKIINFYYNHLTKHSDDRDHCAIINFNHIPLSNGKYERDFKVITMIGDGSFGKVYRAINVLDHKEYAIKKVPLYEFMLEKILREIRIGSKVSESQYIVQYKTSWTENINDDNECITQHDASDNTSNSVVDVSPLSGHILYIQMDLCRMTLMDAIIQINSELNQRLGKLINVIGAFIVTQLTEEIVNGMYYLHSLSPPIIHRDLKPSNIFLTDGRGGIFIKIGDFGSAKIHGHSTDNSESDLDSDFKPANDHTCGRGTKAYMAPEVRNSTEYDERCDAYSLGCVMMDLLCIEKTISHDNLWNLRKMYDEHFNGLESRNITERISSYIGYILYLTTPDYTTRTKIDWLYNVKYDWLLRVSDIIEEPETCDIIIKKNDLDMINMKPLSDFIVINKVMSEREKQLNVRNDQNFWVWYGINEYNILCNAIYSQELNTFSNFDDHIQQRIIDILKRAFCIHVTKQLICNFITEKVKMIYDTGIWECDFCSVQAFDMPKDIELVNWKNAQYFGALLPFDQIRLYIFISCIMENPMIVPLTSHKEKSEDDHQRNVCTVSGKGEMIYQLNLHLDQYNEIVNTFDSDITASLVEMIFDIRKNNNFDDNNDGKYKILDKEDDGDLLMIRNLIRDEKAFCCASKFDEIVIYASHIPYNIKCKYAATMDKFCFAVFSTECYINNSLLQEQFSLLKTEDLLSYDILTNFILIQLGM